MMNRRHFSAMAALGLTWINPQKAGAVVAGSAALQRELSQRLRAIERAGRGRLGVHILDTATGAEFNHRPDERFLMCSTFKMLASALVLRRVDRGQESLERRIVFRQTDLVAYSPVTGKHTGGTGLSLGTLCEATLTTSDNTAANLILASFGGPPALTAFARELGDSVTRLDHAEPELNRPHGPLADTTSPRAALHSLQRVTLGDALAPASRETLLRWMRANTTGETRLKAGLPAGWTIADKTGASERGTSNDIGVVWPPNGAPLLVTAYLTESPAVFEARNAALAEVGRLLPLIRDGLAAR